MGTERDVEGTIGIGTTREVTGERVSPCVVKDEFRRQVRVEVVVHMRESLVPVEVVFEGGEFYGIWTDGFLDDSDECATLEAFAVAYGDECWADVAAHRGGPTLSMRELCAEALGGHGDAADDPRVVARGPAPAVLVVPREG